MLQLSLLGKALLIMGIIITLIGVILLWGHKIPFLGRLTGDIYIRRGNFTFYFPLATCIIISFILTLIFTLWLRK